MITLHLGLGERKFRSDIPSEYTFDANEVQLLEEVFGTTPDTWGAENWTTGRLRKTLVAEGDTSMLVDLVKSPAGKKIAKMLKIARTYNPLLRWRIKET